MNALSALMDILLLLLNFVVILLEIVILLESMDVKDVGLDLKEAPIILDVLIVKVIQLVVINVYLHWLINLLKNKN